MGLKDPRIVRVLASDYRKIFSKSCVYFDDEKVIEKDRSIDVEEKL